MTVGRYLASIPERLVRSVAAVVGGTVHETAQLLVPRLMRQSRLYEVSAKNLLRILVEGVGAVQDSTTKPDPEMVAPNPRQLAVRKGAGNVIELSSILAFGFSPLWILAAASDVTHGSRVYLRALEEELKAAGVIAREVDSHSVDDLLGVLEGASGTTALLIDLPPLELEELRNTLTELRSEAAQLPSPNELAEVYAGLRREAELERDSVLGVSSGIGLAFLLSARNVSRRHLVVPYHEDWQPVHDEGFAAYARRVGGPYATAVVGHFHPERPTYTERFLSRNDPGTEAEFCDEFDGGFGWKMDERLQRASHAIAAQDGVWIFDPVAWEPALERIPELGEVGGVVQLLSRHERDCAEVAARLGVPHFVVPVQGIPASGLEIAVIVNNRLWREVAAWVPRRQALVCGDALGTLGYFRGGNEPIGVHPVLRLTPPKELARFTPRHILCGHGAGVHGPDVPAALREALATSRRRLPRTFVGAFRR